jgi:NAD(P)-dependent dehydrogenase (short-subunit alcohol dehydrogenase family)
MWGKLGGDEHDVSGVGDGTIDGRNARLFRLPNTVKGGTHTGRVALVTGAGRGIGAATARLLASEGAAVALAARTEGEIISVAREISYLGDTAIPLRVDVADEDSVSSCFERVRAELGDVTILVNNAGTPGVPLPVAATKPESWRRAFNINVTGAFLCAREALPAMVSANWGRIVNVSSAAARHPVAGMAAYGASKAALDQLTRVLALEGEPYGISVTGVYPGVIDTRMQEESRSFGQDLIGKQLHRMFQGYKDYNMLRPPEEPAELISYLCTPAARRLNGHIIRLEQLEAIKAPP